MNALTRICLIIPENERLSQINQDLLSELSIIKDIKSDNSSINRKDTLQTEATISMLQVRLKQKENELERVKRNMQE